MLRNSVGLSNFPGEKRLINEGVRFNVISITRGLGGCRFARKKQIVYVTLKWPLSLKER